MTAHQLNDFLIGNGIPSWACSPRDENYRLPSVEWLFSDFSDAFEVLKKALGSSGYAVESNDCDDFTDLAVWYARYLHARGQTADSIAFGSFVYERESGGCHSICCAIVNNPGPTLVFFEPQNSTRVQLTELEVMSCSEARF